MIQRIDEKRLRKVFQTRLRAYRKVWGWSQSELAKRTGLQPSAIAHFESGRRVPSFANMYRLAVALNTSIDNLYGRKVYWTNERL